ncbi:MAG: cob(I)yrinic acid a,c-diamide adenosyltransferase [Candidatus Micrarchaeota archaeon]|nr:cob(I)yrinic acid a,c-diamide adenosyltransferase [Candidatus Micrarchaeota archaeon]
MQRKNGLVHVLTGDGNGKTTSAVGLAVRAAGRGLRVAFVQFLKGGLSGENRSLSRLGVRVISNTKHCPNQKKHKQQLAQKGFIIFCKDCFAINAKDRELVRKAFEKAKRLASCGKYDLVVLDEIFIALSEGLVGRGELAGLIEKKHPSCELVLTGRNAPKEIEAVADYVSHVKKEKHPFDRGILSRAGVDY